MSPSLSASFPSTLRASLLGLAAAAALAGAPAAASAATITYEASSSVSGSTMQLARFDPTLGTLTQAELFVEIAADGAVSVDPLSGGGVVRMTFFASSSVFPFGPLLIGDALPKPFACAPTAPSCVGEDSILVDRTVTADSAASWLSNFIGTSAFGVLAEAGGATITRFAARSSVTYTYAPSDPQAVPLPSTLALVGLAAVLAAGARRSRRSRLAPR